MDDTPHASETNCLPSINEHSSRGSSDDIAPAALVRRATGAEMQSIGQLGALLVEMHHALDPQRFLAGNSQTPAACTTFLSAQLGDPDAVILVADDGAVLRGYVYATVEGYDFMALRGPAGAV